MARHPDRRYRMTAAAATDVAPEILYYMVDDPDPEVRRRVAANPVTPRQADGKLANDEEPAVRAALAAKIANLAPRLDHAEPHGHAEMTLGILDKLARDQLPMVRQVVAEVLKNESHIPAHIVQRLARDIEIMVAAPMLEFSPLLEDSDLLDIIESTPVAGALSAISRRQGVSVEVADSVARSDDTDAIIELLNNPTAQMREDTLDILVERARILPPLHEPLVRHPVLPRGAACKLATFVADNLLTVLAGREDLGEKTMEAVRDAVHKRLAETYGKDNGKAAREAPQVKDSPEDLRHRAIIERELTTARAMHAKRPISEEQIRRSIEYEHWAFVQAALIVTSGSSLEFVCDVLESRHPGLILALCWRAGLGTEAAALVQRDLGHVPPSACIATPGYPLTPEAMGRMLADFADNGVAPHEMPSAS
ncbi:DUF2336 domain-containing protein [Oleispirillum naphthae]|uniref:DUF2336 domain-containing protein n=1 Tax=Oleispirillum naphthae TaxID=2838853 RepID=UPI0030825F86